MLVFFLSVLQPAVSVANGSGLVSARLWIEKKKPTMDKAIKVLFVPFDRLRAETKRVLSMSKVR